jgi:regulatory factor X
MGTDYSAHQQSIIQNAANGVNAQDSFESQSMQMNMNGHIPQHFPNQDHPQFFPTNQMPFIPPQPTVDYSYMQPQQAQTSAPADTKSKKTGSQSSQTNDKELRELRAQNEHRSLSDVAQEVLSTERTPRAEKTKQLFAMLWFVTFYVMFSYPLTCNVGFASVAREQRRPYLEVESIRHTRMDVQQSACSRSIQRPLESLLELFFRVFKPAAWVSVESQSIIMLIWRSRMTFRALITCLEVLKLHHRSLPLEILREYGFNPELDFVLIQSYSVIPRPLLDTTNLLADDQALPSPALSTLQIPHQPDGCIFVDPSEPGFQPDNLLTSNMYEQHLEFHPPGASSGDVLEMPDIWLWIPKETDVDAAHALVALYRSHCTSLVDSVRFCKEKTFFKLFKSFQGTLTVPVGKLFADPKVAGWVKECDWLVYQKMLEQLYPLTLQVMPVQVMRFLDNIARQLHIHITTNYNQVPRHVLEAKLEPANLFCELVGRMLKVNQTAHAAARVVESREFRESLLKDWVHFVNPKRIMESELPGCGYHETYKIITQDIPSLLSPIPRDIWSGTETHYRSIELPVSNDQEPAEPIVDKIGNWLSSLPSKFPNASARTLVDCIKNIGTAAMRDMTIGGASSFNAWWILKVYIDEMVQWLASSGGFLAHQTSQHARSSSPLSNSGGPVAHGIHEGNGAEDSQQGSRYGSMDVEFAAQNGDHQSKQAPLPKSRVKTNVYAAVIMSNSQHGPNSTSMQGVPQQHNSKKRRSEDFTQNSRSSSPGKKLRFSQDTSQPHFEQHPSFATSSFNSIAEPRPHSSHDMHDDSGIDLGLGMFMENGFDASKELSVDDRLAAAMTGAPA